MLSRWWFEFIDSGKRNARLDHIVVEMKLSRVCVCV